MIPIIGHTGKGKTMETVKRSVVARSQPGGREGRIGRAHRVFSAVILLCMVLQY